MKYEELAAERISSYLTLGSHHSTKEAQTEIAEIISKAKKDTALSHHPQLSNLAKLSLLSVSVCEAKVARIKHETWEEVMDSEAYTEGMTVLRERGYWIIQDLNQ
tara:strand:+ start:72 stop:386 length:315 start_codon:yes stop_codon:yes gene_type:complete